MEGPTKIPISKLLSELIIVLMVEAAILCISFLASVYERGFYCDDESLRHPFKKSTVHSYYIFIFGFGLNLLAMITLECVDAIKSPKKAIVCGCQIPNCLWKTYYAILIFCFGAFWSQLITESLKYSVGRLRPHFYTVCLPEFNGITCENISTSDPTFHQYIVNFKCTNPKVNKIKLKKMRLSFPSGHSSLSMYAMVYLAVYLQKKVRLVALKLVKHFLQFGFILLALLTGMSRISDYKHHWSDVLSGFLIGATVALITVRFVSPLFQEKDVQDDHSNMELAIPQPNNGVVRN